MTHLAVASYTGKRVIRAGAARKLLSRSWRYRLNDNGLTSVSIDTIPSIAVLALSVETCRLVEVQMERHVLTSWIMDSTTCVTFRITGAPRPVRLDPERASKRSHKRVGVREALEFMT